MDTKVCIKCKAEKLISEYQFKDKKNGLIRAQCKDCIREYRQEYYSNNKKGAVEYAKLSSKKTKYRNQQFVWDYLLEHPCVDCFESNPVVLDFDHRNSSEKVFDINRAVASGWSLKKLKSEIDKCDVRCSNCHRIRTAKQFNWHKNIIT